jgi:hypothetical protein
MEQIFRMPHFVQILEYCYFNEIDSKWSWRSSISNQRFISFNSMNLINFFTYYVYIKQSMYSVVIVVPRRLSQNCLSRNKLWEKVSAFTLLEGRHACADCASFLTNIDAVVVILATSCLSCLSCGQQACN